MGLFQNVQTQSQPLELLTAVVRDKALNPLSGVAVEFFVKTGQAYFAPEEGLVKIQARLATIAVIGGSANNASPTLANVIYKLQALP